MARDYKNIKAWQLADQLVVEVYKAVKNFPKDELYGLTSQIRRSAVSAPTNVAEGASRQHKKDYLQFLYVARGSLSELEYLLSLSLKPGYLSEELSVKLDNMCNETKATLFGLIKSVEKEI